MPRLLILCEFPTLLGGERSMLATLPAVTDAGFDVRVAAPPAGPLASDLRSRGLSYICWQTHDEHGQRFPLEQLRSSLAEILGRVRPDLLHANSLSTSRIAGPVARDCRVPSIGHLRDIIKLSTQAVADLNENRCLLAVSRATRDFHVAHGLSAERCVVLNNGVDLNEFHPRTPTRYLHRELALPADEQLIAVIGQVGLRKGTDVALAAALQLADPFPAAHWLVVGERSSSKEEAREFEALVRSIAGEPPLAGRVHFLGTRRDVSCLLAECDLLVHAARQEPLGRVLLEAAASGLAVVATDVGGTREIFPNETAVLVPPDNCASLAEAVGRLLSEASRRKQLGAAARARAESAFDIRQAAARLIEQYQCALA